MRLPRWFQKVFVFQILCLYMRKVSAFVCFFIHYGLKRLPSGKCEINVTMSLATNPGVVWSYMKQLLRRIINSYFYGLVVWNCRLLHSKAFSNSGEHIYFHVVQRHKQSVLFAISIQNPWNESSTILWLLRPSQWLYLHDLIWNLVQISNVHVLRNSQSAPVKDRNPWANFSPEWNET